MIVGYFDNIGRPYVDAILIVRRFNVHQRIRFLVDTGSDSACLHPEDARDCAMPFDLLSNRQFSRGIGGTAAYFRELAALSFADGDLTRLFFVDLLIAEPNDHNEGMPSLLGRDVINRWSMEYDPSFSRLEFTVRHADYTLGAP